MLTDRQGKLSIYSLGIVVEDKARDSDEVKLYPVEELPMVDGKVDDHKLKYNSEAPDAKGIQRNSQLKGDAIIVAKWLPFGVSNRITSPDVIKNETVVIWKYADTDEYRWSTIFREPSIRRLETVCHMYGDKTAPLEAWDKDSSYWVEASTHDQHFRIHTSNSNGEPFIYDVKINAKEGNIVMRDDVGNFIKLDSVTNKITVRALKDIIIDAPHISLVGDVSIRDSLTVYKTITADKMISTAENLSAVAGCSACEHPQPSGLGPMIKYDEAEPLPSVE